MKGFSGKRNTKDKVDTSLEFIDCSEIAEEGRYIGELLNMTQDNGSYRALFRPYDESNPDKAYSVIRGWLPKDNNGNNVTTSFLEAFDHPAKVGDVIGKKVYIYVAFNEDCRTGQVYANVVDYEKIEG